MKARAKTLAAVTAAGAFVALVALARGAIVSRDSAPSIVKEAPIAKTVVPTPTAMPEATSDVPGLALPRLAPVPRSRRREAPPPPPPLDTIEPWTGEDLGPRVEAERLSALEIDRQDPYDPSVTYGIDPSFIDPLIDRTDPWKQGSLSRDPEHDANAHAVKAKAPKVGLDSSDPWTTSEPL
jgi:hypothetical protein